MYWMSSEVGWRCSAPQSSLKCRQRCWLRMICGRLPPRMDRFAGWKNWEQTWPRSVESAVFSDEIVEGEIESSQRMIGQIVGRVCSMAEQW